MPRGGGAFGQNAGKQSVDVIGNEKGIILVDNFCTRHWSQIKEKEIYQRTSLSPGPYCFSEPQATLVKNLIQQYNVHEVILYYDTDVYLRVIDNFLIFLQELKVSYTLEKTPVS